MSVVVVNRLANSGSNGVRVRVLLLKVGGVDHVEVGGQPTRGDVGQCHLKKRLDSANMSGKMAVNGG